MAGPVVLWGDLHDVAADDVDALEAAQDRLRLARREAAGLGRAGTGGEGGIEPIDVEGDIGRPVAYDVQRLGDDALDAELCHVLDMDHRHAALVGELPEKLGGTANADLDRAGRVEHPVKHGEAEGTAL